jgi:hypothetical protein
MITALERTPAAHGSIGEKIQNSNEQTVENEKT